MNIRTKLTLGIGLLFLFIMALSWISILKFNNLSNDSRNILRDNHNSLNYSMAMLRALENWGTDAKAADHFRENLALQQQNVTENGEGDFTDALSEEFTRLGTSPNPAVFAEARKDIYAIIHLNMDAIARKSAVAEHTASDAKIWLTGMGTFSVLIALLLLLNLPGNIANPIRELTQSIEAIAAQQYKQRIHFKSGSEFGTVADSFNVMAEKLEEYHASKVSALLMEKKRIDTLINNMRDPVVGLDESNTILFVNNEALIISGLSRDQVVGRSAQ
ncbi:MAG: HAMP domain-containing protein, partial [Sphingobacteriales bacterium]